ncbi:MAG: hypothetical protein KDA36_01120 [Planctomycetaceae bacterium]|nr:hypothetical protein [Planctomycetaceae bacterium]
MIATLTFLMSGAMAVPVEAGIVPWVWDTVFGPVGSIRARRMCNVGYGFRNRCSYGPAMYGSYGGCSPCGSPCGGSPCSSGACGIGCGYGYGGAVSMGGCASGSCASGQCGVNFYPEASPSNLTPARDTPPSRTTAPSTIPPTFGSDSLSSPRSLGGTNVSPNLGAPQSAPGEFDPNADPADSAIDKSKRTPARPRPNPLSEDDENGSIFRPSPIGGLGGTITWSSSSKVERLGTRNLGTRSVQVTRQAAFPNSKWEVAGERREVAKK